MFVHWKCVILQSIHVVRSNFAPRFTEHLQNKSKTKDKPTTNLQPEALWLHHLLFGGIFLKHALIHLEFRGPGPVHFSIWNGASMRTAQQHHSGFPRLCRRRSSLTLLPRQTDDSKKEKKPAKSSMRPAQPCSRNWMQACALSSQQEGLRLINHKHFVPLHFTVASSTAALPPKANPE